MQDTSVLLLLWQFGYKSLAEALAYLQQDEARKLIKRGKHDLNINLTDVNQLLLLLHHIKDYTHARYS